MSPSQILSTSNNWDDFSSMVAGLPAKQQGDCFELLTKYYLLLDPTYRTKLNQVWLLSEVPAAVRRHLCLPDQDEGIDLVAVTKEGAYWAIQCKFRTDESASLTRRELSTFTDLAFGVCKNFTLALVSTTADRLSHKLKLHGDRLVFCTGDRWTSLGPEFFEQVHRLLAGTKPHCTPRRPMPHQQQAILNAGRYFDDPRNVRGKLIWPCGTGKSLTGYWVVEALDAKKILVAAPSLALVKQSLQVWATEALANDKDFHWICVCSDEGVARTERDDAAVRVQDLGVEVHTDPCQISDWLRQPRHGRVVVFTTYQSGRAIAEGARLADMTFDVGIFDEAHNTVGKKGSLFGHLLHDENIAITRRIFMTATERRYRGQGDHIISMDDPVIYGETFDLLSFKTALESQPSILSDYQIVTIVVTRDEVAQLISDNRFVRPDRGNWRDDVEAEMLVAAIALRKAMQTRDIHHAVSFHSSVARARVFKSVQDAFGEAFPEYDTVNTFHVSGAMPTAHRSRIVREFAADRRALITNARCLTEGVDVPNIDCILFADPRKSTVDIVQAVGRALRTAEGKKVGYVVIPVLIDTPIQGTNIKESPFDSVLCVLRALAANDERIIDYFRTIASSRKKRYGGGGFEIEIPDALRINAEEFVASVEMRFWSRLAKLSWRPFEEAREFVRGVGLRNMEEWTAYCLREMIGVEPKPSDIPSAPHTVYKEKGWVNLGDWLGTGTIATHQREYRPFDEAREFVRCLGLKNQKEWAKYISGQMPDRDPRPPDIPTSPHLTYRNEGWVGYGDWIGTGTVAPFLRQYRPFAEARAFIQQLNLKSIKQWRSYCRGELKECEPKPADIPANPHKVYRDGGWVDFGDWLGTGIVASYLRSYKPFKQARAFVRRLSLRGRDEWRSYCKGELAGYARKPDDIPTNPQRVYRNKGWKGMGDWLGTGAIANVDREYRPFEPARAFVRSLRLHSSTEWRTYCIGQLLDKRTKPADIPAWPPRVYKDEGWTSWGDWLGTGTVANQSRVFRSFKMARRFVRRLNLRNLEEWNMYCRGHLPRLGPKPMDIPANPDATYREEGWKGFGDWLGTGTVATSRREYKPFEEARKFARELGLRKKEEWDAYIKHRLPSKGKKPEEIPAAPQHVYKDVGWAGWGDWLGTGIVARDLRTRMCFEQARAFVHELGLTTVAEWRAYCGGKMPGLPTKPDDIPASPHNVYKDDGWAGWRDWLRTRLADHGTARGGAMDAFPGNHSSPARDA
ncbi:MAG: integrase repeat-containing protein [Thermoguttaceae bacterium]